LSVGTKGPEPIAPNVRIIEKNAASKAEIFANTGTENPEICKMNTTTKSEYIIDSLIKLKVPKSANPQHSETKIDLSEPAQVPPPNISFVVFSNGKAQNANNNKARNKPIAPEICETRLVFLSRFLNLNPCM
jgi:hypothetical protein